MSLCCCKPKQGELENFRMHGKTTGSLSYVTSLPCDRGEMHNEWGETAGEVEKEKSNNCSSRISRGCFPNRVRDVVRQNERSYNGKRGSEREECREHRGKCIDFSLSHPISQTIPLGVYNIPSMDFCQRSF